MPPPCCLAQQLTFKVNSVDPDTLDPPLSRPAASYAASHKHRSKIEQDIHGNYTKFGQSTMVFSHEPFKLRSFFDLRKYFDGIEFSWFPWDRKLVRFGRVNVWRITNLWLNFAGMLCFSAAGCCAATHNTRCAHRGIRGHVVCVQECLPRRWWRA